MDLNSTVFYYIRLAEKAKRVILSCKTLPQLKTAKQYCVQYYKATGDYETYCDLCSIIVDAERSFAV